MWLVVIRLTSGIPETTVFSTLTTSAGLYRTAAGKTACQVIHEHLGVVGVAFADDERGNQLRVRVQRNERPDIAIAKVVERSLLKPANEVLFRADEISVKGVNLISVKKKISRINRWTAPFGSFVPSINPQQIQDILDEKNARCTKYREKCDVVWLVLIVDRFKPSSFSLIPEMTLECSYSHSFDSAFLFFHDYTHSQKPPALLKKL